MTEYIYQQTVIQWRIPILPDGKLGNPQYIKKFTTEFGEFKPKKAPAAPKPKAIKIQKTLQSEQVEEEYM